MKATTDLAMARSSHCCDKAKNYRNKEMSKWPKDCRNNRFFVATKNFCHDNGNFVATKIEENYLKNLLNSVAIMETLS